MSSDARQSYGAQAPTQRDYRITTMGNALVPERNKRIIFLDSVALPS